MIQINLLPVRVQKKKEGARQLASIYLLTICLAGAIIGLVWWLTISKLAQKNRSFPPCSRR